MATAKRLPSGSYRAQVCVGKDTDGKPIRQSFTAPTRREAEHMAAQASLDAEQTKELARRPSHMTVVQAVDAYIAARGNVLSPATIVGYRRIKGRYMGTVAGLRLEELRQETVQSWINELAAKHAPKTVRNAHGLLTAVLREYNPRFVCRIRLPQKARPNVTIPNEEELLTMIDRADVKTRVIVLLAADCGLRRSEIAGLEWRDVNFAIATVCVHRAVVYGPDNKQYTKLPKSYAGDRSIDCSQCTLDALAAIHAGSAIGQRVLQMSPAAVVNRFNRLAAKLSLPHSLHDLRHYNASSMLHLGVPDKYAMERLGQATHGVLERVYQHTMADKMSNFAGLINRYFDGAHGNAHGVTKGEEK